MNSFHANLLAAFDVDIKVVHEDGFFRFHPELLQSDLEDLRFGLHRAHLRGDDHLVEDVVELFTDDEVPQVAPGIRDKSGLVLAAQRSDVFDERPVDDIPCKEFLAYSG